MTSVLLIKLFMLKQMCVLVWLLRLEIGFNHPLIIELSILWTRVLFSSFTLLNYILQCFYVCTGLTLNMQRIKCTDYRILDYCSFWKAGPDYIAWATTDIIKLNISLNFVLSINWYGILQKQLSGPVYLLVSWLLMIKQARDCN